MLAAARCSGRRLGIGVVRSDEWVQLFRSCGIGLGRRRRARLECVKVLSIPSGTSIWLEADALVLSRGTVERRIPASVSRSGDVTTIELASNGGSTRLSLVKASDGRDGARPGRCVPADAQGGRTMKRVHDASFGATEIGQHADCGCACFSVGHSIFCCTNGPTTARESSRRMRAAETS